jgi:hypothetical protein
MTMGASPTLTFNTGLPTETYLNTNSCIGFGFPANIPNWWGDWDAEHKSQGVSNSPFTYQLTLDPGSGDDAGSKTYSDVPFNRGNAEGVENTTIMVTHTPAPFTHL